MLDDLFARSVAVRAHMDGFLGLGNGETAWKVYDE